MDLQAPIHGILPLLKQLYDVPPSHVRESKLFLELQTHQEDKSGILSSIPATAQPSHRPLHLLYTILTEIPGPWPAISLIRCFARLSKLLPEAVEDSSDGQLAPLISVTSRLVKGSYSSLSDFIRCDARPALRTEKSGGCITYKGLHDLTTSFFLPTEANGRKPVVAIALPNGPLLAATCMAVATYYTAAPVNPAAGPEQFRVDVTQAGAKFILTTASDYGKLRLSESWVHDAKVEVLQVEWDGGDGVKLVNSAGQVMLREGQKQWPKPNTADDISLILFTSGTSGTRKVVPLTLHSIVAGVVFVMDSWGLTSEDICLNMMPLYHVGGLVRNIFAPIFSGGSAVCCAAFDPNLFWDVIDEMQPTWYYASPSMHSIILAQARERLSSVKRSRIRLACNAAGGLLPSLACQLRDTFNCVVLPSYGMTECMPISTPRLDYRLDREGTSGISTGPELTILDWSDRAIPSGTIGRICVRSDPVFPGYLLPDGSLDKSPFNANGWFDTGDLGYMDDDGYLYITGRSKEVINRGGELISPFEVENAIMSAAMAPDSPISGRVSQALAFSASHNLLQEVVAVALVTPANMPRVDLKALQNALRSSLQQAKWPALITYMDDLPKKNNKVLRINLGQRLGLPDIDDDMPYLNRHWRASCPEPETLISVPIKSWQCSIDHALVSSILNATVPVDLSHHCRRNAANNSIEVFLAPARAGLAKPQPAEASELRQRLFNRLHNYMVPETMHLMPDPLPTDESGNVDEAGLQCVLEHLRGAMLDELAETTEGKVTNVFANLLSRHSGEIPHDVDFFSLGGDSLRAGRLMSALRSMFNVQLPIDIVFNQGSVKAISAHIDKVAQMRPVEAIEDRVEGCRTTKSSTRPLLMALQLIPLVVMYPLRRALQWTVFIIALSSTQPWPTNNSVPGRLVNVTLSIILARLVIRCVAPVVGIAAKWLIIGRYREGLYPMWGWYHTRWWMVQKLVSICGSGLFDMNEWTTRLYCRLMGAKIGKNVELAGVTLGEWDLLDIRDGAVLNRCICRPFAAEGNTSMYLGKIIVGENCSIGMSSIVAAGTEVPANTCIGPNSSSWETEDADEGNRDLSLTKGPKPHWLLTCLLTVPLSLLAWVLSLLPWAGGLVGMVLKQPPDNDTPLRDMLDWFTTAERVAYHYLALILRSFFSPFVLFAFAVLIRVILDGMFGKLGPSPAKGRGAVATWRAALMKSIMPVSQLHEMTTMFGQHYEATSVALRMLGSRVGKRVYWPGSGPSIGDYHLLDVGDDVVFGSRAHLVTTDGTGSDKVTIRDRAMIADRVCLLPGVEVGEQATMGSGALTRRGKTYGSGGTFVGSKGGDAVCLSTGRDLTKKQQPRTQIHCIQRMNSDDTLNGDRAASRAPPTSTQIQHMSSDDTLAESRKSSRKWRYRKWRCQATADPFVVSDSDSDSKGNPPMSETVSPFGRAFYLGLAPYHVMGPFGIFCYSSFMTVFTSFYWNVPNILSIQVVNLILNRFISREKGFWVQALLLYGMSTVVIAIFTTLQAVLALAVVIAAKWALLGRRQPGNYDWDKSSYCQRWQLFLCIEKLRRQCYGNHGVLGLITGTYWIVLYFRALGATIGEDCALFANGSPSLMFTEPDLITLGHRVAVDDASVVAHINTRGKFDLNKLEIGDRCVLRTGSRLLSGAIMKQDSCLLEHTLVMGGDVVEERYTMQGWPAERFLSPRIK